MRKEICMKTVGEFSHKFPTGWSEQAATEGIFVLETNQEASKSPNTFTHQTHTPGLWIHQTQR